MISIDDPIWGTLLGGYRQTYDASVALRRLEGGEDVWDELWLQLHHQGDVGEASYAAVPQLVRIARGQSRRCINFYGLISVIEVERHRKTNPLLPRWLEESYFVALKDVLEFALLDLPSANESELVQTILGAIALAKGEIKLGAFVACTDSSEIDEFLDECCLWSEAYRT